MNLCQLFRIKWRSPSACFETWIRGVNYYSFEGRLGFAIFRDVSGIFWDFFWNFLGFFGIFLEIFGIFAIFFNKKCTGFLFDESAPLRLWYNAAHPSYRFWRDNAHTVAVTNFVTWDPSGIPNNPDYNPDSVRYVRTVLGNDLCAFLKCLTGLDVSVYMLYCKSCVGEIWLANFLMLLNFTYLLILRKMVPYKSKIFGLSVKFIRYNLFLTPCVVVKESIVPLFNIFENFDNCFVLHRLFSAVVSSFLSERAIFIFLD